MAKFEYKSIPAPKKGEKAKGVKGSDGRMAQAMTSVLNDMGALGWEYLRADTLPLEERAGLTSKAVHYYTVLVFRREMAAAAPAQSESSLDVEMTDVEHAHVDAPAEARGEDGTTAVVAPADGTPRPSLTATRTP
ncbi:DUF4177 domain-containing protein [Celeribacter sp.]|uniref:DUF4177 domain-containing protein n=1 Tax=Celeribacter sp. TaxID=1890673 RepID=UPI003A8E321A